jgi:23S rRNA (cytosine1962-C5)-methyltransferase
MNDTSDIVRVVVKPRRAQPFFGRHPWVFESAIDGVESSTGEEPEAGTAVQLWSTEGRFIAHGLWNPTSTIRVRLYSWQQSEIIDEDFLATRIHDAVQLRRPLFDLKNNRTGCRLIFSEADNLSGLTVDFYGGFLLVQFKRQGSIWISETTVWQYLAICRAAAYWTDFVFPADSESQP